MTHALDIHPDLTAAQLALYQSIFKEVKTLIADPKHWTTLTGARTAQGTSVVYDHESATCFCSLGAVHRVYQSSTGERLEDGLGQPIYDILDAASFSICKKHHIHFVNDYLGHDATMKVWDEAIKMVSPHSS